jgi:hypothetical protein
MWIFLNDSALSVVADRHDSRFLRVRARVRGDIERVFPNVKVRERRTSDYRFFSLVSREIVARVMAEIITDIDYDNFKDSVEEKDRSKAYFRVWWEMAEFGDSRHPRRIQKPALRGFGDMFNFQLLRKP